MLSKRYESTEVDRRTWLQFKSLKDLQTNMYVNEQSVILIQPNARVSTVKAVNSFDIFFMVISAFSR